MTGLDLSVMQVFSKTKSETAEKATEVSILLKKSIHIQQVN